MKVTVVGCSGSMSGPCSASSCYLVQAPDESGRIWSMTLDMGSGALGALWRHCSPADLDGIILSHMHADHVVDMIGMHVFRRWHPDGPLGPIPVLAPTDAVDRVRGVGGDAPEEDYSGEFRFVDHDPAITREMGPFRVESFPVLHPVPTYAVRITGPSSLGDGEVTLCYSGDTDYCDGVIDAARGVDLFLCEAAFREGVDTVRGIHLTGRRAGQVAEAAAPKSLVLTHIQPWTDPHDVLGESLDVWQGPTAIAQTGAVFTI
ncbi:MBL fold metallo-hydrolase [Bowdeniella nasicola]|uniref:MBL fold metallo-hydrolase n=1 Tax=Bowdeniella nasicola TaxID=208480 RepID=A0A1Q5Q3H4_9ACTO|nr:MBL fold metallo-hydrolase [Bowdeniella nasicola]OKL54366.1 MBL fold metallo-hydrolase [Bowdeniella nasicola]